MAFDVKESDGGNESREKSEDLKLNVGLGVKMPPRIRVVECVARGKALDQAFIISIVGHRREGDLELEVRIQIREQEERSKHAIGLRTERAWVSAMGTATSRDQNLIVRCY
jgi:hypothetical protein